MNGYGYMRELCLVKEGAENGEEGEQRVDRGLRREQRGYRGSPGRMYTRSKACVRSMRRNT